MKAMTNHIQSTGTAMALGVIMSNEIMCNKSEVSINPDWSNEETEAVAQVMDAELAVLQTSVDLYGRNDSVKGENAMQTVYPKYAGKATDAITLCDDGALALSEAKYLIKVGGRGPFGGPASFKNRVSGKFNDMKNSLAGDGESTSPLRIVVVTEEQLPLSIIHVRGLLNADYPHGSFSSDGSQHDYVLCSSRGLNAIIRNPAAARRKSQDYLFFRI